MHGRGATANVSVYRGSRMAQYRPSPSVSVASAWPSGDVRAKASRTLAVETPNALSVGFVVWTLGAAAVHAMI